MARVSRSDCAVRCKLINTHTHTHKRPPRRSKKTRYLDAVLRAESLKGSATRPARPQLLHSVGGGLLFLRVYSITSWNSERKMLRYFILKIVIQYRYLM